MTRKTEKVELPGDVLRLLLTEHNLSQEVFADWIGVSRLTINQIINHHRGITADVALRIAAATFTEPEHWLDMQQKVDLREARAKLSQEIDMITPIIRRRRQRPPK